MAKRFGFFLCVMFASFMSAQAFSQNRVVVLPLGDDDLHVIPLAAEEEPVPTVAEFIDEAIGKEIRWTKGPDTNVASPPRIDPTVVISFLGNTGLSERNLIWERTLINFDRNRISHWGEQQVFDSGSVRIYGTSVLMVDRGDFVEGGRFEWVGDNQGFVLWNNVVRTNRPDVPWIRNWTDPKEGDKVYFFLMSPDERFSSNPIEFIWPGSESLEGSHD